MLARARAAPRSPSRRWPTSLPGGAAVLGGGAAAGARGARRPRRAAACAGRRWSGCWRSARCRSACRSTLGSETASLLLPLYGVVARRPRSPRRGAGCGAAAGRRRSTSPSGPSRPRCARCRSRSPRSSASTRSRPSTRPTSRSRSRTSASSTPRSRCCSGCCSTSTGAPCGCARRSGSSPAWRSCSPLVGFYEYASGPPAALQREGPGVQRPQALLPGQLAVLRPEHLRALPRADDDRARRDAGLEPRPPHRGCSSRSRSACCGRAWCCRCRSRASRRCSAAWRCSACCAGSRCRCWGRSRRWRRSRSASCCSPPARWRSTPARRPRWTRPPAGASTSSAARSRWRATGPCGASAPAPSPSATGRARACARSAWRRSRTRSRSP